MIHRRLASTDYSFVDEWRIGAEVATVRARLRDVEGWPSWWPSVLAVRSLAGNEGEPPRWRFVFRTRLPYEMSFDAALVQDDPRDGVRCRISGKVDGFGTWRTETIAGGTLVRFAWRVRPGPAWMRLLSPVARPVFGWNHRALMIEGGQALAADLGSRLLAPTLSRLSTGDVS